MKKRQFATRLHLGLGVHSFGNNTMLLAKPGQVELEILDNGVLVSYVKTTVPRRYFVPWSNVKAVDLRSDCTMIDEEVEVIPQMLETDSPKTTPRTRKN